MPLSEEELRMLQQMEQALVEEDPKFASTLRGTTLQESARKRAILAGVVFVAGIAVMMTGAIMQMTIVGIVGFVVMLGSAFVAVSTVHRAGEATPEPVEDQSPEDKPGNGFRNPFDRRHDEG